jgi:AcrR family transcriptional regulator
MESTDKAEMKLAVIALVGEGGVANLSPEAVCARAQVPLETFLEAWPDGRAALRDALDERASLETAPNTGSLIEDLVLYIEYYLGRLSEPGVAAFMFRLMADLKMDRDLGRYLEPDFARRRARNRVLIQRAIDRGDLPADVNGDAILDAVLMQGLAWVGKGETPSRLAIGAAMQRAVERGFVQPRLAEIRKPSVT